MALLLNSSRFLLRVSQHFQLGGSRQLDHSFHPKNCSAPSVSLFCSYTSTTFWFAKWSLDSFTSRINNLPCWDAKHLQYCYGEFVAATLGFSFFLKSLPFPTCLRILKWTYGWYTTVATSFTRLLWCHYPICQVPQLLDLRFEKKVTSIYQPWRNWLSGTVTMYQAIDKRALFYSINVHSINKN